MFGCPEFDAQIPVHLQAGKIQGCGKVIESGEVAETYECVALFVPQAIREGSETAEQCDRLDCPEEGIRIMTALKIVVRNTRAQVVDMMEPDITREPLEDSWQLIK